MDNDQKLAPIRDLFADPTPRKWVFTGDSITHGAVHTYGWRDYTELFSERVRTELNRVRDVIIKTAINGRNTRQVLQDFDWGIGQFQPDVLFVMLGMNDCAGRNIPIEEFQDNLKAIAQKAIDGWNCKVVMQTTCTVVDEGAPGRAENLPDYMEAIRALSKEMELPLIDHTAYWKQQIAAAGGRRTAWLEDPFHPNNHGHQAFAELVFKELNIFDEKAASCRLFRP